MGGKKKAAAKKGGKADDTPDESVNNFWKAYKKRCQTELNCDVSKVVKVAYDKYLDEDEPIKKFVFWEELGWVGVRAIMESLKQVA
jgi:hypothetical protein